MEATPEPGARRRSGAIGGCRREAADAPAAAWVRLVAGGEWVLRSEVRSAVRTGKLPVIDIYL